MNTTQATETQIPATREAAISLLVEQDVARWGESERASSETLHGRRTYGLALNELANRAEMSGEPSKALRAAAKKTLTKADRAELAKGR